MKQQRIASQVTSVHNVVMLAGLLGIGLTGSIAVSPTTSDTMALRSQSGEVAYAAPQLAPHPAAPGTGAKLAAPFNFKVDGYYDQLRKKMNWLPVRYGGDILKTPDAQSRILLAQSAAQRAGLAEVGLNHRDVYGIINAETTGFRAWAPARTARPTRASRSSSPPPPRPSA
ncbi:hypothetical protein HK414_08710 [Ramlibacter terrae]|uniref:Uncharacterized protein n=1 Tax=Ramlibacter terrae TaxID=2732511 RepID=A0ABX6P4C6_9BURK|nr:hypothetical protein HK414_08710 [Ramlibacter terrae]